MEKLKCDISPHLPPVDGYDSAPIHQLRVEGRENLEEEDNDVDNQQSAYNASRSGHTTHEPAGPTRRAGIVITLCIWPVAPTHGLDSISRHIAQAEMLLASCSRPVRIMSSIRSGETSSTAMRSWASSD